MQKFIIIFLSFVKAPTNRHVRCDEVEAGPSNMFKHKLRYSDVYSDSEDDNLPLSSWKEKQNVENTNNCGNGLVINVNDFVVVKLCSKKWFKHFVGLVLEVYSDDEISVKFMQKCGFNKFIFPEKDDISSILHNEIVLALSEPTINKNSQYSFNSLPNLRCFS